MDNIVQFPPLNTPPAAPLSRAELAGLLEALNQIQRSRKKCGDTAIGAYLETADLVLTSAIAKGMRLLKGSSNEHEG
jgi:hypothetical protein